MPSVNVKVAVRVRPLISLETDAKQQSIVHSEDGKTVWIDRLEYNVVEEGKTTQTSFTYDYCYGRDTPQESIYKDIGHPTLQRALEGYNGTIFAYGQTSSGKTHTMMGSPEDPGLIPLINKNVFDMLHTVPDNVSYMVTVSYLELYNENTFDLLNPSQRKLEIRQSSRTGVYVKGLAEIVVKDHEEIAKLMEKGNHVRHIAATKMNDRSSRSHCIFTVKIEQKEVNSLGKTSSKSAKLNLVDLAGSERVGGMGATGARFR
eukprot:Rmarinus@m.16897